MAFNPYYSFTGGKQNDPSKFDMSKYTSQYDDIFKDTDYWDTYQGLITQYSGGVPDSWWRNITGKTASDLYNHEQSFASALNALAESKRTTEYNSESATADRMRSSGLNPDLLGTESGSQTGPAQMQGTTPMQFDNPIPHMVSFLSMIGGAVTGAQSMVSQKVVNDGMRLQNLSLVNEAALGALARSNIDYDPATEIMPAISLGFNTGSRSLDRKLDKSAKSFMDSIPLSTARKGLQRDLAKTRKEMFDITSSAGYSDNDDFYSGLAEKMADAYLKLQELQMSNTTKKLNSDNTFLDNFDSALSATSQNTENQRNKNKNSQWNEIISIQHGVIGYIRDEAKKGNPAAIDTLFRIFGENVGTSNTQSIFNSIGLGIEGNHPIFRGK